LRLSIFEISQQQGETQLLEPPQQDEEMQVQAHMPLGTPFTGGLPAPPLDPFAKAAEPPLPFGQAFMGGY